MANAAHQNLDAASADPFSRPPTGYRPPAPIPLTPVRALWRNVRSHDSDLLALLPRDAYEQPVGKLGYSRRGIVVVNDPVLVRDVMANRTITFPKGDMFVGALSPLVGNGMFISEGEQWRTQRRMIEPSFSHIHVKRAFEAMDGAVADMEATLSDHAASGTAFALDDAMTHLTADIISRAIFSVSLRSETARSVFEAFDEYLASVANVDIARLILSKPFAPVNQPPSVRAAARRMRAHMADWIAAHRADGTSGDIAADIMAARDPETGEGFDEETLIDQIGVFFLAGHETTANALTWAFHILSEQPDVANAIRTEVNAVAGDGPVTLDVVKQLPYTRAVLKETMRLYPPLPFLPRVAMKDTAIGSMAVKRGAMIMIAPWTIHRYRVLWPLADRFDPGRFSPDNEKDIPNGAYIPFGLGPRICVGSGFALVEGTLALARLVRRFTLTSADAQSVRPVARLAIRPHAPILTTVTDDG